jgi:hypothetical protein
MNGETDLVLEAARAHLRALQSDPGEDLAILERELGAAAKDDDTGGALSRLRARLAHRETPPIPLRRRHPDEAPTHGEAAQRTEMLFCYANYPETFDGHLVLGFRYEDGRWGEDSDNDGELIEHKLVRWWVPVHEVLATPKALRETDDARAELRWRKLDLTKDCGEPLLLRMRIVEGNGVAPQRQRWDYWVDTVREREEQDEFGNVRGVYYDLTEEYGWEFDDVEADAECVPLAAILAALEKAGVKTEAGS